MEIKLLDIGDAERYRELRIQSLRENPEAFLTTLEIQLAKTIEQVRDNLIPVNGKFTLGAFELHELVGMVTFVRESHPKTMHKGNLLAMYVSPEYRGHGIGKALVQELVSRAAQLDGLEQINLTVIANNDAAKRLYASVGFEVYGTERNAMKEGGQYWDDEFMVLRLK
ncbi:GNAT family N-acetyltransferase [Paenibacillus kobensis]|uniref:GNAT family N-acetyltransferase n=1 Tax=Paenibacillus kobensis TaxID=59841 RepID=UPI000FD935DE|nr:GNAT family N-acetyltransferase [Paenibacillus kobensis]